MIEKPTKVPNNAFKRNLDILTNNLISDLKDNYYKLSLREKSLLLTKLIEYRTPKLKAIENAISVEKLSDAEVNQALNSLMYGTEA